MGGEIENTQKFAMADISAALKNPGLDGVASRDKAHIVTVV
jgi:hypothetical protein